MSDDAIIFIVGFAIGFCIVAAWNLAQWWSNRPMRKLVIRSGTHQPPVVGHRP